MIETILNKFESERIIKERLFAIKEAFVSFYGEKNRALIEEQFAKIQIICYQSPENIINTCNSYRSSATYYQNQC